jgi:hypothetical protein
LTQEQPARKKEMLPCMLILEGGNDNVTNIFAYIGSQYNDYSVVQLHRPLIDKDTRPNIVDAPLTFIIRRC